MYKIVVAVISSYEAIAFLRVKKLYFSFHFNPPKKLITQQLTFIYKPFDRNNNKTSSSK
jgi:hypothetical protein